MLLVRRRKEKIKLVVQMHRIHSLLGTTTAQKIQKKNDQGKEEDSTGQQEAQGNCLLKIEIKDKFFVVFGYYNVCSGSSRVQIVKIKKKTCLQR